MENGVSKDIAGVLVLLIAALAGAFWTNLKTLGQLRTMKAFVEGYVFADAVAACEKVPSTTRSNGIPLPKPRCSD